MGIPTRARRAVLSVGLPATIAVLALAPPGPAAEVRAASVWAPAEAPAAGAPVDPPAASAATTRSSMVPPSRPKVR